MKLLINAMFINWGKNGGTETYVRELVSSIAKISDASDEYYLLCNSQPPYSFPKNVTIISRECKLGVIGRIMFEQFKLRQIFKEISADILWNPGYVGLAFFKFNQINTVHDAYCWTYPREIGFLRSLYWRVLIPLSIGPKTMVISVSEATKRSLLKYANIDDCRVTTILEGDGLPIIANSDAPDLGIDFRNTPFFLSLGGTKEIKNCARMIIALNNFNRFRKTKHTLVVTGGSFEKFRSYLMKKNIDLSFVKFAGMISEEHLEFLYEQCTALAFASLDEGFGLPILEAQKRGVVVITSNQGATAEIAGAGAILVDPLDCDSIMSGYEASLERKTKSNVIKCGYSNVKNYSWETAAKQTFRLMIGLTAK